MRLRIGHVLLVLVALMALLVLCGVPHVRAQTLQDALKPCGLPYECVTDLRLPDSVATWRLMVDPKRPAIYEVAHWSFVYDDKRRVERLAEYVWSREVPPHYRCFVRERRGVWYTLGIRTRFVWRAVLPTTREYHAIMMELQHVVQLSNQLRHSHS